MRFVLTAFFLFLGTLASSVSAQDAPGVKWWSLYTHDTVDYLSYPWIIEGSLRDIEICRLADPTQGECLQLWLRLVEASFFTLDHDKTETYARQAFDIARAVRPAGHEDVATATIFLGTAVGQQGRIVDSENLLRDGLRLTEALPKERRARLPECLALLAANLDEQLRFGDAYPFHERAFQLYRELPEADSTKVIELATALGVSLARIGDFEQARAMLEAVAPRSDGQPPIDELFSRANYNLAVLALAREDFEETKLRMHYASIGTSVRYGMEHPKQIDNYILEAGYFERNGEPAAARRNLEHAYLIAMRQLRPDERARIVASGYLGEFLLRATVDNAAARSALRDASTGALRRLDQYTSFGAGAKAELRDYRPVFTASVEAAWRLANR